MPPITHVLCPVDFSETSRAPLRLGGAIAEYLHARLTVLTVDDPMLAQVSAHSAPSLTSESERELRRFADDTLARGNGTRLSLDFAVAVGKPAAEILRFAREREVGLIVMSSEGRSGARKMFFGSTTERVLRETPVPVLVMPPAHGPHGHGDVAAEVTARQLNRIIVPVDFAVSATSQLRAASRLATELRVPLVLVHVLEPVFIPHNVRMAMSGVDTARRERAEEQLAALADSLPDGVHTETMVLSGDPSEEITKLVNTRQAHLIVIGLHSSGLLGPRMGSVTYRVICMSHAPVLALPPDAPSN
jgi:nucleotide-binding universal stress UspA family protein